MQNEELYIAAKNMFLIWNQIAMKLQRNPAEINSTQMKFWRDYLQSSQDMSSSIDKRFKHDDWKNNFMLDLVKRSYMLFSEHSDELINNIAEGDSRTARKLRFYMNQFIDAVSPSNFPNLNPEVFSRTLDTSGANLVAGLKQFFSDLDFGTGKLNAKMVDMEYFKVGKNLAITPGKVIFQNDLIQLIEYTPTTDKYYEYPLLILPPWINKYYILDLQDDDSFVRWLVGQGMHVFMVSWVNPTRKHRDKTFSDYLTEGALAALDQVLTRTDSKQANVLGYCIGGTLTACMLAYLNKMKSNIVRSATLVTTLVDFSEPGDLGAFIDDEQISDVEKSMEKDGYMDGNIMAATFNALRANDLIWNTFINNYLKGEKPKQFDLLYWNADPTNIPAQVHSFYLRKMYLHNYLIQPNKLALAGVSLDLRTIKVPSYFLATKDDHIIPWGSCYMGLKQFSGPLRFTLAASGHVAGVVNPPYRNKYGYWTNEKIATNAEKFLKTADYHDGSWWNDWLTWLKQYAGQKKAVPKTKRKSKAIENAPGSYVKVRLQI